MRDALAASGGDLSSVDLLSGLLAIGRRATAATLRLTGRAEEIVYTIDEGDLIALRAPEKYSPVEILVRSGKIQRETIDALRVAEGADRFEISIASGVVSKREAAWAWKMAAIETLAAALSWPDGTYEFTPDALPQSDAALRLPVARWILELFLRSQDRPFVLHRLGPVDLPLSRCEGFEASFSGLGLTADADAVAGLIDGRRTADEVIRAARSDEFAVLKLLGALMAIGLIRPLIEEPFAADGGKGSTDSLPPEKDSGPDFELADEGSNSQRPPAPEADPMAPIAPIPVELPLAALTAPEPEADVEEAPEPLTEVATPILFDESSEPRFHAVRWIVSGAAAIAVIAGAIWLIRGTPSADSRAPLTSPTPALRPDSQPVRLRDHESAAAPSQVPSGPTRTAPVAPPQDQKGPGRNWAELAKKDEGRFAESKRYRYTIQLEIACEESTLDHAFREDRTERFVWIVPMSYRGQSCFRVLWGRYASAPDARRALSGIPRWFLAGGNHPTVIRLGSRASVR